MGRGFLERRGSLQGKRTRIRFAVQLLTGAVHRHPSWRRETTGQKADAKVQVGVDIAQKGLGTEENEQFIQGKRERSVAECFLQLVEWFTRLLNCGKHSDLKSDFQHGQCSQSPIKAAAQPHRFFFIKTETLFVMRSQ